MDFAPMGWASGAAVGIAPGPAQLLRWWCLTGDGSYLMRGKRSPLPPSRPDSDFCHPQRRRLRHGQTRPAAGRGRIDRLATAHGGTIATGRIARLASSKAPDDFDAKIDDTILNRKSPTLLDIRIDGEEVPPMSLRHANPRQRGEQEGAGMTKHANDHHRHLAGTAWTNNRLRHPSPVATANTFYRQMSAMPAGPTMLHLLLRRPQPGGANQVAGATGAGLY